VVPSGIPDRAYEEPSHARLRLGFAERPTIMTFGLLSPDKGIETMVRAMPSIVARVPQALYRIVGATHPHLVAHEGEAHRERLIALARELGVEDHLQWDNRFLDEDELLDQIAAADIYVTPYRNPAQITSGTLAYAAGLGKPIVATPYVHAQELLADGKGCLVGFDDAEAMGAAIGDLLTDDARRTAMAGRIYRESRGALWENMVAAVLC
jgi:glycosyltransferase involved in cell wall biosynthesis